MASDPQLRVGSRGLRLAGRHELADTTHDVIMDDHRVWSFSPSRDLRRSDEGWMIPWPHALKPLLVGRGPVQVREHVSGRVAWEAEVSFGGDGALRIAADDGTPLAIDKGGNLTRMFAGQRSSLGRLADEVVRLLDFLNDDLGVPAYLNYGGLLGAVRDGNFIGHDNDADIGWLSDSDQLADVIRDSYELERRVQAAGWRTLRMAAGTFKAMARMPDGTSIGIDVFVSFYLDGVFHLVPWVRTPMDRGVLLPLGSVELEGRQVAAPARPEELLAHTYGEAWRIPDPSFKYRAPRGTSRRFGGWFHTDQTRRIWNDEWAAAEPGPGDASDFAAWVAARLPAECSLVDVGAGAGDDSAFFAREGHAVTCHEYAHPALGLLKKLPRDLALDVRPLNLYSVREVLVAGGLAAHAGGVDAVYSRGVLDWLRDDGRQPFWLYCRMALKGRGAAYVEFRTNERREHAPFALRRPRPLSHLRVIEEIEELGGEVEVCDFVENDPGSPGSRLTCRLVVRWS